MNRIHSHIFTISDLLIDHHSFLPLVTHPKFESSFDQRIDKRADSDLFSGKSALFYIIKLIRGPSMLFL